MVRSHVRRYRTPAVAGLLLVAVLALAGVSATLPVDASETITNTVFLPLVVRSEPIDTSFEAQVIALTNVERAKAGCSALTAASQLAQAAEEHSTDMALNDYFSHTSLDGRTPWDRIVDTGYVYTRAAENIAAGYSSPTAVVQGWMASDGHRANILNCDLTEIGVGYFYLANDTGTVNYRHYWTQVFATPRD